jgi:surface antigen
MKLLLSTLLAVSIITTPSAAAAQSTLPISKQYDFFSLQVFDKPVPQKITVTPKETKPVTEPTKPEPVIYLVVDGDNLSKIGTAYNVEWQRLWAKNTQLTNPDLIHVGDQITIPEPSEQLERALPAVVALPAATPGVAPRMSFDGGNGYDYGYCTWYVKNRRGASIPNNLGNANTWYSRAAAAGMAVGSEPRPGAVGTTTRGGLGHVVYVESVNADGSINISEMNYQGWGVQSSRTTSASEFVYIY